MSLDLWKEFASSNQKLVESPWTRVPNRTAEGQSALEEDEFGDFEIPEPRNTEQLLDDSAVANSSHQAHPPNNSLAQSLGHDQNHYSSTMQERHSSSSPTLLVQPGNNDFQTLGSTQAPPMHCAAPHARQEQAFTKPPQFAEPLHDVEWGDFSEESISHLEDSSGANTESNRIGHAQILTSSNASLPGPSNRASNVSTPPRTAQAAQEQVQVPVVSHSEPPPSNVPPPSILLLLIIGIFQSMLSDVKNMIASADSSAGPCLLLDQQSASRINKRFSIARAAARIIAGRKLLWRRDSRLSQSMRIGPANAGKSGGMKLTGIDRTEHRREDGEVEEALRLWKQQMGSLRAIVTTANSRQPSLRLLMPEISDKMPVRVGRPSEGAMAAPNCCFLCGLRREERVEKVDVQVEDSFGEWWTDYWGHVDCRIFWEDQKHSLHQR
ncbi:hypothetical protein MMC07_008290 [Pseudocyphellaria aurata]|nr:hypothetical protein [Pseudocyphellaria aurata]